MQPDMRGFRRRMSKRDGPIKRSARLFGAADLHEQRTAHTEEVKITGERDAKRLDHRKLRRWTMQPGNRNSPVERHDRRRLQDLQHRIQLVDLAPVGRFESSGAGMNGRYGRLNLIGARTSMTQRLLDQR